MKEIHEQPRAVQDTIASVVKDGRIDFSSLGITTEEIQNYSQIHIVACGSAYHVGATTQYVMEDLAKIPVRIDLASEFRYRRPLLRKNDLVMVISQSGETADTIAAMKECQSLGARTLAIVNVVGSTIDFKPCEPYEMSQLVFISKIGPQIIRNIDSAWKEIVALPMKLKN